MLALIFSYLEWTDQSVCKFVSGMYTPANPETLLISYINSDDVIGVRNVLEIFPSRWQTLDLINTFYRARSNRILRYCRYIEIYITDVICYAALLRNAEMLQWIINADMLAPEHMGEIMRKDKWLASKVEYPPKLTI